MQRVGVLATFRVAARDDLYPRLFLREFEFDGVLWPFVIEICQAANDASWPHQGTAR